MPLNTATNIFRNLLQFIDDNKTVLGFIDDWNIINYTPLIPTKSLPAKDLFIAIAGAHTAPWSSYNADRRVYTLSPQPGVICGALNHGF
jgi:hypothetical protein